MNTDFAGECNALFNVLHALEQHVAPADLTAKRLLHEARERLQAIEKIAQRGPPEPRSVPLY
jgi:hypothetical protein